MILTLVLVVLTVVLLVMGATGVFAGQQGTKGAVWESAIGTPPVRAEQPDRPPASRLLLPLALAVRRLDWYPITVKRMAEADWALRPEEYLALKIACGALAALVVQVRVGTWELSVVVAILASFLPNLYRMRRSNRRQSLFSEQLVDAMVTMASGLRAGQSTLMAIESVARNAPSPLGNEFAQVVHEMNLGAGMISALENMRTRVRNEDLNLVFAGMLLHQQVGGNLAEMLDQVADLLRERVELRGQLRALTSQGRMSAIVIVCLPFAVTGVLTLLNPHYISQLFASPVGWALIGYAILSICAGIFIIRRMLQLEY